MVHKMRLKYYLRLKMDPDVLRNKIRSKIEEKNLSVRQAAISSGISSGTLQNFLAGLTKSPTLDTIAALAKTLDCDLMELVGSSDIVTNSRDYKLPWDSTIFLEASKYVIHLQSETNVFLPSEEAMLIIKEIYYYSRSKGKKEIDKNFAEWVFNKSTRL
jgi:transcriptional regulator with XRE-family HTH domain